MRALSLIVVGAIALLSLSAPTQATPLRVGLPPGLNLAIGVLDGSIDYAVGPMTLGVGITGVQQQSAAGPTPVYNISLSGHLIWELLQSSSFTVGVVAGYKPLYFDNPELYGDRNLAGRSLASVPRQVPVYIGDFGLTLNFHHDFQNPWGGTTRVSYAPTFAYMLDGEGRLAVGPTSAWELGVQVTPQIEILLPGLNLTNFYVAGVRASF